MWWTARYGHFTLGDDPHYLLTGRMGVPNSPFRCSGKKKMSCLSLNSNPGSSTQQRCENMVETTVLGAFAKLRKTTVSFVRSVRPSIHFVHMEKTRFPLDVFSWNLFMNIFPKTCRQNSDFIKILQEFLQWDIFHKKKCTEYQNTHFMLDNFLGAFRKICEKRLLTFGAGIIFLILAHSVYKMWIIQ